MTENSNTPAPAPDWVAIRARYEAGAEKVSDIAASVGLAGIRLSQHAKKQGWAMRGAAADSGVRHKDNVVEAAPNEKANTTATTAQTLQRLKDILTKRISHLETDLSLIGEEVNAISNERDIRSANTLVRTLEKVLELEHRERKNRARRARESARLNDAERDELARRIEGLCDEGPVAGGEQHVEDQRSAEAAVGLAAVGTGGSTSAAG